MKVPTQAVILVNIGTKTARFTLTVRDDGSEYVDLHLGHSDEKIGRDVRSLLEDLAQDIREGR